LACLVGERLSGDRRGISGIGMKRQGIFLEKELNMYETINFQIRGIVPLLMHNIRHSINPLDPMQRQMKELTSKRKKTDQDYADMSKLEWFMGIYVDENNRPCIPGEMIEAMMIGAARKNKRGKDFQAGAISDGNWPVEYSGARTAEELWEDESFRDCRAVVVQRSRVLRTRPIFREWSLSFEVSYLPEVISSGDDIRNALKLAGQIIGLGDYRPRYGRFEVVSG